tara:strand:+ start:570 stop:776 length:207 start_codon:yes stop_codon:yes gene_type:complete
MKSWDPKIIEKLNAKYLTKNTKISNSKTSDINVLLNRITLNKKSEIRKKLYFSAATTTGLILFGLIIF